MFILKTLIITLCVINCLADFPSQISRCKAGDVDCVVSRSNEYIRKYKKGDAIIGFQQYDPFHIENVSVSGNSESAVNLQMFLKQADIHGLSEIKFDRAVGFTKDGATTKFELYGIAPEIKIIGQYKTDGRVILLPIKGEGDIDLIIKDVKVGIKVKPSVVEKDGKQYMQIQKIKVFLEPKEFNVKLTNLFNGNKELGDSLNVALNENWKDVWSELTPTVLKTVANVIKDNLQPLFDRYNYDDFYLSE